MEACLNTFPVESLKVPGKISSLSAVASYVQETADLAGLSKRIGHNLRRAINELATKVIVHGFEECGLNGELVVKREITGNWVIIVLEDTAKAYDPHAAILSEEERYESTLDAGLRGLGLFLTTDAVDHFDYERRGERNRNKFFVRRPIP